MANILTRQTVNVSVLGSLKFTGRSVDVIELYNRTISVYFKHFLAIGLVFDPTNWEKLPFRYSRTSSPGQSCSCQDFLELCYLSQGFREHLDGPEGHLKSEGQDSISKRSIFKVTFEFRVSK